jgi:dipeptidyl aminopeptidase/acylaminoacyl peptidase
MNPTESGSPTVGMHHDHWGMALAVLHLLSWRLLVAVLAGAVGIAPLASQPTGAVGSVLERLPYAFPFSTHAEWIAFMATSPETTDLDILREAFPPEEFTRLARGDGAAAERIVYANGGLRFRGLLARPTVAGRYPVIVYNRGGNREFGRLVFLDLLRMLAIAQGGYIVVATEYRGEGGSDGEPMLGNTDADDVLALIPLLGSLADADTSRIAMIGFSRGGLVTYHALSRDARVRAAVIVAGAADLLDDARRRPAFDSAILAKSVAGYSTNRERALREASAMNVLPRIPSGTALLLLHGTADDRVHPSVTLRVSEALLEAGTAHRMVLLENGSHSLLNHATVVRREIDDWLARYFPPR